MMLFCSCSYRLHYVSTDHICCLDNVQEIKTSPYMRCSSLCQGKWRPHKVQSCVPCSSAMSGQESHDKSRPAAEPADGMFLSCLQALVHYTGKCVIFNLTVYLLYVTPGGGSLE